MSSYDSNYPPKREYTETRRRRHSPAWYRSQRRNKRMITIDIVIIAVVAVILIIIVRNLWKPESSGEGKKPEEEVSTVSSSSMPEGYDYHTGFHDDFSAGMEVFRKFTYAVPSEPLSGNSASPAGFFEGYSPYMDESTSSAFPAEVNSTYCVLVNLENGHVEAARNADVRISPASMTKILTILTASSHIKNLDDTFTVSFEATNYSFQHECTAAGFTPGEIVTVRDLFYGTILPSGADAALCLADYVAGSTEAFTEMMNEKVRELGLSDTAHFTNPIGIYDINNQCTALDMAMILKAAEEDSLCSEVLSAHTYTTSFTSEHPQGISLSNWFLRRIEDKDTHGRVMGAKTGFVVQSGNCAASYSVSNSGSRYICVTGNAHSAWRCIYDHVAIYDAFTN